MSLLWPYPVAPLYVALERLLLPRNKLAVYEFRRPDRNYRDQSAASADLDLLRAYEPVVRYTQGELFFPISLSVLVGGFAAAGARVSLFLAHWRLAISLLIGAAALPLLVGNLLRG